MRRLAPQGQLAGGDFGSGGEEIHHLEASLDHADHPPGPVVIVNRGALPRGPDHGRQAKAVLRVGVEEVARIAFRRRPRGLGREKVLPGQQPAQRGPAMNYMQLSVRLLVQPMTARRKRC